MIEFKMPALGADMESGTLVEWLVKPGDEVAPGSIIAVVETQKGAIEVETFTRGRVADILIPVGERVPVGAVLAHIDDGKAASATPTSMLHAAPVPVSEPSVAAPSAIEPPLPPTTKRAHSAGRIMATPIARRRAAELGVDLSRVNGTGFQGSIRLVDIETYRPAETPLRKRMGFDAAEMRKAIAAAMSRAKREIPHYYLAYTLDLSRALAWLE
jgi:pyruvate dehydrogenase E2 component (dihydrolipoamide acetyltransferase)